MIIHLSAEGSGRDGWSQRFGYDVPLLVTTIGLCVIGSVFVLTSSAAHSWRFYNHDPFAVFLNHLVRLAIGLVFMITFALIDYRNLKTISRYLILLSILSLIGVLFVPLPENVTAHRWYYLPGFNVQPAEFAKFALIIYLAARFSVLTESSHRLDARRVYTGCLTVSAFMLALILMEPNLSMVVLIMATAAVMFLFSGVNTKAITIIGAVAAIPLAFVAWLTPYMRERLLQFTNGIADPMLAGYQVKQSVIGIGHGGIVGVGLGESTRKFFFLPEPHKDFIFSIVGEELGLIGALITLSMLFLLIVRGWRIARHATDWFGYFLGMGITASLATSMVVNVAVTLCLLPPTGQPLPLISYGGSSLIMTLSAVGILLNISRTHRTQSLSASVPEFYDSY